MISSSSRFQRNDSHRLGSQNTTLLNLQMDNKVRNRENNLMFKEHDSRNKMVEIVSKIRNGEVPQLKKSMVIEELTKEEKVEEIIEEHKEDKNELDQLVNLQEIYREKPEPESQEMNLVFKQGEPKMKAIVDLAIKRFIKEKSWK